MSIAKLLSVIVPVYNVANYLDECITSILMQTYSNLELILIDDGSTDSSGKICDAWAQKDKRIIVRHQQNQGVGNARNTGIYAASGEYVAFIDADDFLYHRAFEYLISEMQDTNSEIAVCGYVRVKDNLKKSNVYAKKAVLNNEFAIEKCIEDTSWHMMVWNKIFRRSCIWQTEGKPILYANDLSVGEDALWLFQIMLSAKRVVYVPKPMYFYRYRCNSAVAQAQNEKIIAGNMSRYEASYRCYRILKENHYCYSWKMLRRCIFSIRDIVCNVYLQDNQIIPFDYMQKFKASLLLYLEEKPWYIDILFIVKNLLIYYSIIFKMPRIFIKRIYKLTV